MDAVDLLAHLTEAALDREASALVADHEHTLEVSVAPGAHWVVRSWQDEWVGRPDGVRCWQLIPAGGAVEITHGRPPGWVHPVIGLLWPALLPIWGRPGDDYKPLAIVDGVFGPAQVVLSPIHHAAAVGTLHVDARRWVCTALELPDAAWTLTEYLSA